MKFLDEYRDTEAARKLTAAIARTVTRPWTIMEVCGGQTHTIVKYGIDTHSAAGYRVGAWAGLPGVRHFAGDDRPGARHRLAAGGHLLLIRRHAPGAGLARRSARSSKSQGGDVRVVYSPLDAVNLAAANPDRRVVFFAIGFETTAPPNAMAVWLATSGG